MWVHPCLQLAYISSGGARPHVLLGFTKSMLAQHRARFTGVLCFNSSCCRPDLICPKSYMDVAYSGVLTVFFFTHAMDKYLSSLYICIYLYIHGRDMYLVKPTLGPPKKFQHLTRLRIGHTKATKSHIIIIIMLYLYSANFKNGEKSPCSKALLNRKHLKRVTNNILIQYKSQWIEGYATLNR